MKRAFLFSGQGSQYTGMGLELLERDREWFDSVELRVPFELESLLREGPEEKLDRTLYTQPALFVVSHLILRHLRTRGLEADVFAGHSLGELNALVAADWVTFDDMLPVVIRRGEAMDRAAQEANGGMVAVLKLDPDRVKAICTKISSDDANEGTVEVALLNSPVQVVVSGATQALERFEEEARNEGALKVVSLDVSGPWHSRYMQPAQEPLREVLEDIRWNQGKPFVNNVTAEPVSTVEEAREGLVEQLVRPVRWFETVRNLRNQSVGEFVEVGPGKVLHGLVTRILSGDEVVTRWTDNLESTNQWLEER